MKNLNIPDIMDDNWNIDIIPEFIKIDTINIPETITLDISNIPSVISVTFINLLGDPFSNNEDFEPLTYNGEPVELKIDLRDLLDDDQEAKRFRIVPERK